MQNVVLQQALLWVYRSNTRLSFDYGIIPVYTARMISDSEYTRVLAKLDYIEHVKKRMASMLQFYCSARLSPLYVCSNSYEYASACIEETLDDLFFEEARSARRVKESYERKDYLASLSVIRD